MLYYTPQKYQPAEDKQQQEHKPISLRIPPNKKKISHRKFKKRFVKTGNQTGSRRRG
jgi:hypothetical protein